MNLKRGKVMLKHLNTLQKAIWFKIHNHFSSPQLK